jgi:N-acetylneuraminic acid mutarotase
MPAAALAAGLAIATSSVAFAAGLRAGPALHHARAFQSATMLNDGRVLVTGGFSIEIAFTPPPPHLAHPPFLTSAEIYNPRTNRWTETGSLNTSRAAQMAALLRNGMVLVAGGENEGGAINSAELFNPRTGKWSVTGSMIEPRSDGTATLLDDGRVLVAGGAHGAFPNLTISNTAELYNPKTGTWTAAQSMHSARVDATATVIRKGGEGEGEDGRDRGSKSGARLILMAGGADETGVATATAEIYDARTGTWTPTGSMNEARSDGVAALLSEDKVLVAGGAPNGFETGPYKSSAELYDIESGTWSKTGSMANARNEAESAILLGNGLVFVSGGHFAPNMQGDTAELYNPETGTWSSAGTLSNKRAGHTTTLLRNGNVLIAGGLNHEGGSANISVDIYVPGESD